MMRTRAAVSTAFAQTKKETIETAIILTHQAAGAFQCKRELRSSVIAKPKARLCEPWVVVVGYFRAAKPRQRVKRRLIYDAFTPCGAQSFKWVVDFIFKKPTRHRAEARC
jgi:hypothetical protein